MLNSPIKISHIADVHFRSLTRHDEYKKIFESYIEQVKNQRVDHIFIGGDIFHTKTTGLTPEYIDMMVWWFNALASVATVHVTLGNHDGNLVNASRQDAISPIVAALKNPKIKLYKDSGVYSIEAGINLCVYSLFDVEGWNRVEPKAGCINIACYHGAVKGAKTETGWEVEGDVDTEMFEKYDACFLGDIHHPQILGFRKQKDKNVPWIAYPGSTVQQNYGEQRDHYHILWTFRGKDDYDFEYASLPNPHPFVTLMWDGSVDALLQDASTFPMSSRFRIKIPDYVSQKEIHDATKRLRKERQSIEVTFTIDQRAAVSKEITTSSGITFTKNDLRNIDTLIKLMKDTYKKAEISEEDWKSISGNVSSYLNSSLKDEESPRNVTWSLRKLEFDNTFSYGEGNVISFDDLSGIVGLFGKNRIGKSSIIGTLLYTLFNATDRGAIKNLHVINARKQHCLAKAIINVAGVDYVIERQTVKSESKKGIISAPTSLNLFKMDGGELVDLVGEQRNDTEKQIRSIIGTVEDFMTTSASTQGDINRFIFEGSAQRKAFISKLLDLNIFETLHGLVKEDVTNLKAKIKSLPTEVDDKLLQEMQSDIERHDRSIEEIGLKLKRYKNDAGSKRDSLAGSGIQIVTAEDISNQKSHNTRINLGIEQFSNLKVSLEKQVEEAKDEIANINLLLGNIDATELRRQLDAINSAEIKLSSVTSRLESEKKELVRQKRSLEILNDVPCGDDFPSCKFIKDAHELRPLHSAQEDNVKELIATCDDITTTLAEMKKSGPKEKLLKLKANESKVVDLNNQITRLSINIIETQSKIDKLQQQFENSQEKLVGMEAAFGNNNNAAAVKVREEIQELEKTISSLEDQKLSHVSDLASLKTKLERYKGDISLKNGLLNELKIMELISHAFSKKGLPSVITGIQLPLINSEISKILGGIVEFTVELVMDDDGSLEIYINYGDSRRLIELGSGMEKMIASLAIRVALTQVSSLPKPDIFIIDEGFGVLDEGGVDACNKLLVSLKRYFKTILLISHSDGIKDVADCQIEIYKNENDSKVIYDAR
jgi:DNA repair exonuclease SbcCD ATPase subunit